MSPTTENLVNPARSSGRIILRTSHLCRTSTDAVVLAMTLVVHLGTLLRHCSPKNSPCPAVAICVHRISLTALHHTEIVTRVTLSQSVAPPVANRSGLCPRSRLTQNWSP